VMPGSRMTRSPLVSVRIYALGWVASYLNIGQHCFMF
jgi:hypothetical protein